MVDVAVVDVAMKDENCGVLVATRAPLESVERSMSVPSPEIARVPIVVTPDIVRSPAK